MCCIHNGSVQISYQAIRDAMNGQDYSMSLTDRNLKQVEEFEEEREYVIRDLKTGETLAQGTISATDDIGCLLPDSQDLSPGIKGFPIEKNGVIHKHPDDENGGANSQPAQDASGFEQVSFD